MAPRRKQASNSDMPTGLSPVKHRGVIRFRYRYPSGKDFWFPMGTTRNDAVEAACIFNAEYRNPHILAMENADKYNRPLAKWLPKVIRRVRTDERLSPQVLKTFLSNCDKLIETHGSVYSKSINLEMVNDFIEQHASNKSIEVQNRKILFLCKVFDYLVDMSAMSKNYARDKKLRPTAKKLRQRLKVEDFELIYNAAPNYLKTAMALSIQTTHAVLEISLAKYKDCRMLDKPELLDGVLVFGYMRIHRQKVKTKESSRVEIPITSALKQIIEDSRNDKVLSPYIVHAIAKRKNIPKVCDHPTQLTSDYLSKAFSRVRDELGILGNIEKAKRPTFHEIRALSIHLYDLAGYDPQARAAHANAETTKIYKDGHIEWVRVPAGEIKIG
ncbi:integrase [Glaciecola sp. 2405UD65-10]|uniref:integrase n=1 Tax=Glaciecola sp. 2405UD65-10 TaxID=3397244 RepID=UPI003B59D37C